jgi:hypothetical protein
MPRHFTDFLRVQNMPEILRKEVQMSFEDAVKRVETLAEEGGFTILLTKGMHDMFRSWVLTTIRVEPSYLHVPQILRRRL